MRGSIATLLILLTSKPEMRKVVFLFAFFPLLAGGKTVRNEVIIVHKLVPFMINFRGFLPKQEQLGCFHAIVVSNHQRS